LNRESDSAHGRQGLGVAVATLGLGLGGALSLLGQAHAARWIFASSTVAVLVPTAVKGLGRVVQRQPGVDLLAVLGMGGALLLGEAFAGAVLALMLTGGAALERYAAGRARRELRALVSRTPRSALRLGPSGTEEIPLEQVRPGDVLRVLPGTVIPADGVLVDDGATLDEAALTGESRPVLLPPGAQVRSGGTNAGGPLALRVTVLPSEGTWAGIVRLVRAAEASRPPFVRWADRAARLFVALSLGLAGAAWLFAGPERALAVLVVATPCPLLLAAPAAWTAGLSRAARRGVLVKGGAPLEALAGAKVLLLDKTGTVTRARPQVVAVEPLAGVPADEVLRVAASLEQASFHPYAPALVEEARARGLSLVFPDGVEEVPGQGVRGRVGALRVAVGQQPFVAPAGAAVPGARAVALRNAVEGSSGVYVAIDGVLAGAVVLHDPVRPEAPRAVRALREAGMARIHMVTGDHPDVAELVGDALGVDRVFSQRTPAEKVEVIRRVRQEGPAIMVGDGINDAPALALADVGVAMGARGASAASEAADVVLTADRLDGLVHAVEVARHTRRIARQSVGVGMGLSLLAMAFAAAGYLRPAVGAVLQEGIDVLVLLNALRALGGRRRAGGRRADRGKQAELARGLASEHRVLQPRLAELVSLAAELERLPPSEARLRLQRVREMLERHLLPHELEEQRSAYPVLGQLYGREDPTGLLVQTHQEIRRRVRLFSRWVESLPNEGPGPADLPDLRRALYGLHAVLTLHFAQEEEVYSALEGTGV
jgi:heavy metal translocating P-type ATPase